MRAFIINTDAASFEGRPHDIGRWVAHGLAFSGGRRTFGEAFRQIAPGDFCLMYENGEGVRAIGRCKAPWDEMDHTDAIYYTPMLYPPEYRLEVDWGAGLLPEPLALEQLRELCRYKSGWAPVRALWRLPKPSAELIEWIESNWRATFRYADEVSIDLFEGARREVVVNAYERSAEARNACIDHWGTRCQVCALDFGERYGPCGRGYIHVHHLTPIASIGGQYRIDPVRDLRPVCPNCHAMLHTAEPPLSIEMLRGMLRA